MHFQPRDTGWIEVVCGSMFSGKTEELIRRLRRAEIARLRVQSFKPAIDDRYHPTDIVSHNDQRRDSVPVHHAREILEHLDPAVAVVGIDEAQFFDATLVDVCDELASRGIRVIVAGLDQDFRTRPFDPMPALLCKAEYITKNLAICVMCGNPANRSQRIAPPQERAQGELPLGEQVVVGGGERYEPRCRRCFVGPMDEPARPDGAPAT